MESPASARAPLTARPLRLSPNALGSVAAALAAAGVAELILQRTFYRVGIFIPKEGPFGTVYRSGTQLGSFFFNVASILVVVALVLIVAGLARTGRTVAAGLAASTTAVALAGPLLGGEPWLAVVFRLLFFASILSFSWPALRHGPRAVTAGLLTAFGCSVLYGAANGVMIVGGLAGTAPGAGAVLSAGEIVVLLLGPGFYLAWRRSEPARPPGRTLVWAAFPAAILLAALTMQPRYAGILVIWTVGLSFVLPMLLYAVSFWLFAAATIGFLRRPSTRTRGLGLVLLVVGGYFPQTTYEFLTAAVAVALWCGASLARPAADETFSHAGC